MRYDIIKLRDHLIEKGLTPAEATVGKEILTGKANFEIADLLGIKEKTVKFHVTNVYKKLKVDNRVKCVLELIEICETKEFFVS